MSVPTIFGLCSLCPDVRAGTCTAFDFGADLPHVIHGDGGPAGYNAPARHRAISHAKRGLKRLLINVHADFRARSEAACDQLIPFLASLSNKAA